MEFGWDEAVLALQAEARAFAEQWVADHGIFDDPWMTGHSPELAREVGRRGWIGMTWPVDLGGGGRSPLERFVVMEALLEHGVAMADWWFADQLIGSVFIRHGTPRQQERWLPGMLDGTERWTIASTESVSGSNPVAMSTVATRHRDGLVLNGEKMWVLGPADWCYVICQSDSPAGTGRGLAEVVVPMDAAGLEAHPIVDVAGRSDWHRLEFHDVHVPLDSMISDGSVSIRLLRELDRERGGIDRLVSNRDLYRRAVGIADHADPVARQEMAQLEIDDRIGRLLVLRSLMHPNDPGLSSLVKIFCSELARRFSEFAVRASGPTGQLAGREASSLIYSTAYTLMGGTSQVLRNQIAERRLGLR